MVCLVGRFFKITGFFLVILDVCCKNLKGYFTKKLIFDPFTTHPVVDEGSGGSGGIF